MGSVSSANPTKLFDYAKVTEELDLVASTTVADVLGPAIEAWNAAARDVGGPVACVHEPARALTAAWLANAATVRSVADAFRGADTSTFSPVAVVSVDDVVLGAALRQGGLMGRLAPGGTWSASDPCKAAYGYWSRGIITGPDGIAYDVVVPYVRRDGVELTAGPGVSDLDGNDPDWSVVASEQGTGLLDYSTAGALLAGAVTMGAGNGLLVDQWGGIPADESAYDGLVYGVDGQVSLAGPVTAARPYESADGPFDGGESPVPQIDGVQLAIDALNGAAATVGLQQDAATYGYCVVYEVSSDGRRRARIYTTKIVDRDGETYVYEAHGTVDAEGNLSGEAMVLPEGVGGAPASSDPGWGVTERAS